MGLIEAIAESHPTMGIQVHVMSREIVVILEQDVCVGVVSVVATSSHPSGI